MNKRPAAGSSRRLYRLGRCTATHRQPKDGPQGHVHKEADGRGAVVAYRVVAAVLRHTGSRMRKEEEERRSRPD